MNLSRNILAVILFSSMNAMAHDGDQIAIWSAAGQHSYIFKTLQKTVWDQSSDPYALLNFCSSQVALGRESCVLVDRSHMLAKQFAGGLIAMWSGQTKKARRAFEDLVRDQAWSDWGNIGLLELAWYTGNFRDQKFLLDRLEQRLGTQTTKVFREALQRYRLIYSEANCEWSQIESYIQTRAFRQVTSKLTLFSTYARALFVSERREKLAELLKAASPSLKKTTEYMLTDADYQLLSNGQQHSKNAIENYAKLHPSNSELTLQLAYADILSSSPELVTAALRKTHEIAKSSKGFVTTILGIATMLATYHKPDESTATFRLIADAFPDAGDFAMFHTLMAWYDIYAGSMDHAEANLRQALEMAPKQISANHLRVLIAKRQGNVEKGATALKNLFECDPYNENYAALILHFKGSYDSPLIEPLFQAVLARQKYFGQTINRRIHEARELKGPVPNSRR